MPLFDLSADSVRAYRRLNSSAEVYEAEIEELFWQNIEAFSGEPLFLVARQARLTGGGIPDLLALDPQGRVVVIEVKRSVDRSQLAQCLEYAGWARTTSLDELAGLYRGGPEQFFTDWQEFTGTTTPLLLDRVPRLVLVARSFDGRTESALRYLKESGVPVTLVTVIFYEDSDGTRIVDVNNGKEGVPDLAAADASSKFTGGPRSTPPSAFGVSLADLLESGVIEAGEPIEWRRTQLGEVYRATISDNGSVVAEDGRSFTSPSTAANVLAGGSHNGWDVWTVTRLGVRLGSLRTHVPGGS